MFHFTRLFTQGTSSADSDIRQQQHTRMSAHKTLTMLQPQIVKQPMLRHSVPRTLLAIGRPHVCGVGVCLAFSFVARRFEAAEDFHQLSLSGLQRSTATALGSYEWTQQPHQVCACVCLCVTSTQNMCELQNVCLGPKMPLQFQSVHHRSKLLLLNYPTVHHRCAAR